MTDRIHKLVLHERGRRDPAPLAALYRQHGDDARRVIRDRREALAREMALTGEALAARALDDLPARLHSIETQAAGLGLVSMAEVAAAAASATADPALPALWARLTRLAGAAPTSAHEGLTGVR